MISSFLYFFFSLRFLLVSIFKQLYVIKWLDWAIPKVRAESKGNSFSFSFKTSHLPFWSFNQQLDQTCILVNNLIFVALNAPLHSEQKSQKKVFLISSIYSEGFVSSFDNLKQILRQHDNLFLPKTCWNRKMTGAMLTVRKKYTLTRHPVLGLKIYIRAWRVRLKPDNFFVLPSVGAKL